MVVRAGCEGYAGTGSRIVGRLPDYIIIGAQRSGTTTLQALINAHPDAACSLGGVREELHFFCHTRRWKRWGAEWYASKFPDGPQVVGEKSPMYLHHILVPRRIERTLPGTVKVIVLLRDPVDRAWSNWHKARAKKFVSGGFMRHAEMEADILSRELASTPNFWQLHYWGSNRHLKGILDRGHYADQLPEWLTLFKGRILVLQSEDLFASPSSAAALVYSWLGLSPYEAKDIRKNSLSYDPMPPPIRQYLVDYYAPKNEALFQLLGERFDWQC